MIDIIDYMEKDKDILPKLIKRLMALMKLHYVEGYDNRKKLWSLYENLIMLGYPKELLDLKIKLYKEKCEKESALNKELESFRVFPKCKEL